jgi:hypothetical protein
VREFVDGTGDKLTDIDVVIDGVYYQVKHTSNAFRRFDGKASSVPAEWVDDVRVWVNKVATYARQVDGVANPIIKYVTRDWNTVPQNVRDYLASRGIEMVQLAGP